MVHFLSLEKNSLDFSIFAKHPWPIRGSEDMACHERQWLIPKQPLKYDIRHIGEGTIGTDFSNNTIFSSNNATVMMIIL